MKLVTAAEMRALEERASAAGRPPPVLMEDAGLAVAQELWISLGAVSERKVVLLIGPGNNGGDGLVAARHLQEFGANVVVLLLASRDEDDPNLRQLLEREISVRSVTEESDLPSLDEALAGADAVVDAVLGTGRARPLGGVIAGALARVSEAQATGLSRPQLFAVDLPTGVDCDTGTVDPHALRADMTIALGCSKVGLHTLPGAEYAGRVEVAEMSMRCR